MPDGQAPAAAPAPAATAAAASPAPAQGSAAAPAPAPAPTPAPTALEAAAAQPPATDWIPEKFRVKGQGDEIDLAASARKIEEHRAHLEKRLGAGDLPPKTADEYTVSVPDAYKDAFKPESDPLLAEFRAEAHKHGLTQAQFDFAIGEFFKRAPQLVERDVELKAEECAAELRKTWADETVYRRETSAALRAVKAYGQADAEQLIARYGNDPLFIRAMARIGAEIKEDSPPAEAQMSQVDFDSRVAELQEQIAKLPRGDGRRVALQAEYDALFLKRYGTAVRSPSGVTMTGAAAPKQ